MTIVDAHAHYGSSDEDVMEMLRELDVQIMNICVADKDLDFAGDRSDRPAWRQQGEHYRGLAESHPERYAWCTTFDLPTFGNSDYSQEVVDGLARDFSAGALGCKIWKNIGMQVRSPSGDFVLIDDSMFEPAISLIERSNKTLVTHTGAGGSAWQPLDDDNAHADYYRCHPEWYMAGRTDRPSRMEIVESRDHVLERHPDLRLVGAHLACLEDKLGLLATRLDRYPNFAVDTSARFPDLIRRDSQEIREFFLHYQDRAMFGLDVSGQRLHSLAPDERRLWLDSVRDEYRTQLDYLRTADEIIVDGRVVKGLDLPGDVVAKITHTNALKWYQGL